MSRQWNAGAQLALDSSGSAACHKGDPQQCIWLCEIIRVVGGPPQFRLEGFVDMRGRLSGKVRQNTPPSSESAAAVVMTSQHLNVHHIVRSVAAPEGAADRRARAVWAGGSGGESACRPACVKAFSRASPLTCPDGLLLMHRGAFLNHRKHLRR